MLRPRSKDSSSYSPSANNSFDDPTLLAAARYVDRINVEMSEATIFDNMVFNQDITIQYKDADAATEINFYLELEQVTLSKDEATVATLKDMRAGPDTNFGS